MSPLQNRSYLGTMGEAVADANGIPALLTTLDSAMLVEVYGVALYQERKTTVSPLGYQKRADLSHQVSFSGNKEPLICEISKGSSQKTE